MSKIDANETNLKKYLSISEGTLLIPFSQRPYEWEKPQIVRFFNDLIGLYDLENDIHMLNFFTLSGEDDDDNVKLFDGQQRTITALLLIAAFINKLDKLNKKDAADQLQKKYLISIDFLSDPPVESKKIKFENSDVNDFFYKLVKRNRDNEYDPKEFGDKTIEQLINNYDLLDNLLEDFINERSLDSDQILKLVKLILNSTKLITIKTDTDDLAMAMFETLNNTGKKLENFYVLKNDLVISLSEDKVKNKWIKIDSNLANYDPSQFLVSYATILSGKSTKNNSLNKIYDHYDKNSINQMEELLNELVLASDKYLQIRNASQLKEQKNKTEVKEYKILNQNIKVFTVTQHYPLLLAMFMKDKTIIEINKVLSLVLNLAIRNFYFKEDKANTIEKPIADLARVVYEYDLNIDEISNKLKEMTIQDDDLQYLINNKLITTSTSERRLKFILRETFNVNDLRGELEIKDNLKDIHYEHILPKNPNPDSEWMKKFSSEEDRLKYTCKIGNATLLLDKINKNISNKDFSDKKQKYLESNIPENKEIAKNNDWNHVEIDQRTKRLGKKIIYYLDTLS